jgi:hypothetical protein
MSLTALTTFLSFADRQRKSRHSGRDGRYDEYQSDLLRYRNAQDLVKRAIANRNTRQLALNPVLGLKLKKSKDWLSSFQAQVSDQLAINLTAPNDPYQSTDTGSSSGGGGGGEGDAGGIGLPDSIDSGYGGSEK